MEDYRNSGISTQAVHAGVSPDAETKAVKRPLVMANSYEMQFDLSTDPEAKWNYVYARDLNPNQHWLEQRLAVFEDAEDCVVTASGVSAVCGTFYALLRAGDHIVASDIAYISVREMLLHDLPERFGISATLVNSSDVDAVRAAMRPNTRLVHIETPGNPTTAISDIAAIAAITRPAGALLTVDSTWSGLTTQRPLALGADLVMHSLSKYINGHGDALGGAVMGPKAIIDKLRWFTVKNMGACISPFNAWQIMRGSATLPLRMERHCQNAQRVAEFLERHPKVAWVRYPGLKSHPQHDIARKQMCGYSAMLNFDILDTAKRPELLSRLKLFTHATSLGHDESLIMVYDDFKGGKLLRVSIGIEDAQDLIADLDQALRGL